MSKILNLAANTFREAIRDRVLNAALVFAVALIGAGVLLGTLSIGQDQKIVKDLGLAAMEIFGVAIAVFMGTSLLHREADKRTIFIVLAKPVRRVEFMLGKFLGLGATLT
ncbi:MAG: ABC transporter permease subunit, partial [Cyanobacteria bacterium REEB65]|nr:ABC transporter permease subunit [Cyanobacteria bacterium REEB65]